MGVSEAMKALDGYDLLLTIAGLAVLAMVVLPRLLSDRPASAPMVLLRLGFAAFALPLRLEAPDPLEQGALTERLTELGVIVALMGAGLKLDRPPGWRSWRSASLLLGIMMPITIAAAALLGWWVAGFVPATAMRKEIPPRRSPSGGFRRTGLSDKVAQERLRTSTGGDPLGPISEIPEGLWA